MAPAGSLLAGGLGILADVERGPLLLRLDEPGLLGSFDLHAGNLLQLEPGHVLGPLVAPILGLSRMEIDAGETLSEIVAVGQLLDGGHGQRLVGRILLSANEVAVGVGGGVDDLGRVDPVIRHHPPAGQLDVLADLIGLEHLLGAGGQRADEHETDDQAKQYEESLPHGGALLGLISGGHPPLGGCPRRSGVDVKKERCLFILPPRKILKRDSRKQHLTPSAAACQGSF